MKKVNSGYSNYFAIQPEGSATYTETAEGYAVDADQNADFIFTADKSSQFWLLSITSDAVMNGTTSALALFISGDGTNFTAVKDYSNTAITSLLATDTTITINSDNRYKVGIFKLSYTKGNASDGTIKVGISYGE